MLNQSPEKNFRIRSFVGRNSRITDAQDDARTRLWPTFGLNVTDDLLDLAQIFGNDHPCYLEIGFGMGQSLLAAAISFPDKNFIGVEPHQPGVGALLMHAEKAKVNNLRLFNADVIDVIQTCLPPASLAGVQIFFPDPWQKRKHHPRRLVQPAFLAILCQTLMIDGSLHLATDWEDYAHHMMRVLSEESHLQNISGAHQFATRSPFRPIVSKFENRALSEGRDIWELQFVLSKR